MLRLVIGDKRFSSWSMRPWVAMRLAGVPFEEVHVALRTPGTAAAIARWSPSGKVPVLLIGEQCVWDSLAIIETVAEHAPQAGIWPREPVARARARSIVAEMHSGFAALRAGLSMDCTSTKPAPAMTADLAADLTRMAALGALAATTECHAVDAVLAPVATRLRTYDIALGEHGDTGPAARFFERLLTLAPVAEWVAAAAREG